MIATNRLVLRQWKKSDAQRVTELLQDPSTSRYMTIPYPYDLSMAHSFITKAQSGARQKTSYEFCICTLDGELIGGIGLSCIDHKDLRAIVGYWLSQPHRGKGYATEAVRAILDFAFQKVLLERVDAIVYVPNLASAHVLEKCGFQKEGLMRSYARRDGNVYDAWMYGVLKKDFHKD